MLNSTNLSDKSYSELLSDALAQIPLYTSDWTNFNVSDPGITLLQNFTAFQLVQQNAINTLSDQLVRNLLKLAGFSAIENNAATLLAQVPSNEEITSLPQGQQLWAGATPFETTEKVTFKPWGLSACYASQDNSYRDITALLRSSSVATAFPFGSTPKADRSLICILSDMPEVGKPIYLWATSAQEHLRNPVTSDEIPVLSSVHWQYYTEEGWVDATVTDNTSGFLWSGAITLQLEKGEPAFFVDTPISGYALRCVLDSSEYDRAPQLTSISVHLFPLKQQQTRVYTQVLPGATQVIADHALSRFGNIMVYCREEADGPYRLYRPTGAYNQRGRFYNEIITEKSITISFDLEAFGHVPCLTDDAIRITYFDDEMVHHRALGTIYGYENQTIPLGLVKHVLPKQFSLMVAMPDNNQDYEYYFVEPNSTSIDDFCYIIDPETSNIIIEHPGLGGDCQLFIANCAETVGSFGNLRANSTLELRGGYDGTDVITRYNCPSPGFGGNTYETIEQLRVRFSSHLRSVGTAVTAQDYETLVSQTPGLCIHKVRAMADNRKNLVKIVVKPYTEDERPHLSPFYLRQISNYLNSHRMLTTRFELEQPRYAPIGIAVTLSVRGSSASVGETVEELLRKALDHINGPQNFGDWVRFNDIYQMLNHLPFVDSVDSLNIYPESRDAVLIDSDIRMEPYSLCCPGHIYLTLQTR